MILSENRYPLFGIMPRSRFAAQPRQCAARRLAMIRRYVRIDDLDRAGEHGRVVDEADHRNVVGNQIRRQDEISDGAEQHRFDMQRRLPVERAIISGEQICRERQVGHRAFELAPKIALQLLLVADHAARQRCDVRPRGGLRPEPHLPLLLRLTTSLAARYEPRTIKWRRMAAIARPVTRPSPACRHQPASLSMVSASLTSSSVRPAASWVDKVTSTFL